MDFWRSASPIVLALPVSLSLVFAAGIASAEQTGWRFSKEPSASLIYAVRDGTAFAAICESGKIGPEIPVVLTLDPGGQSDGASVDITFASEDFDATYAGAVSAKDTGVRLPIGVEDPLWRVLRTNRGLSFKAADGAVVTLPLIGASAAVASFLKTCRTQFSAADAAVPETDMPVENFVCEDGSKFQARFDNSRSYSLALLTLDGESEIALIQGPSGSGVRYSNGDYTLHTKGDDALLMRGDETRKCRSE